MTHKKKLLKITITLIFLLSRLHAYSTTPNFNYGSGFAYKCKFVATDTFSEYTTCIWHSSSTQNFKIARKEGPLVEH